MTELFENRYYKINKTFLSVIGQWPYQDRARRYILFAIFLFVTVSGVTPQIIAAVEQSSDPKVIMDFIPAFAVVLACGAKVTNIIFNSDKMLKLAERMKMDWISLTYQPEIHILHEYAEFGRRFTIAYAAGAYAASILFVTQPLIPQILGALKFINKSQSRRFPMTADYYGIDLETYYFYFLVDFYLTTVVIVTAILATDTMFIVHAQHACGMFKVVSHQMEQMGTTVSGNSDNYLDLSRDPDYKQLTTCNKKHSEAIEFADLLEAYYSWSFFSLVGLNMMMISFSGLQALLTMDDSPDEAIKYGAFLVAQVAHIFFQSFFSQNLMDHSEQVRDSIYQAEWYKTSVSAQKLINMVIMRTYIPCQLTAGKIIVMSLNNFTAIVKTSMSYFTLFRSMQ